MNRMEHVPETCLWGGGGRNVQLQRNQRKQHTKCNQLPKHAV